MDCSKDCYRLRCGSSIDNLHIILYMEDFKMEKTTEIMIAKAYEDGVKAGIQQMMDKIQLHCELGKPVMANGELYFFNTSLENLKDIMDDIESTWNEENGVYKFIVPMRHPCKEDIVREAVISADTAEKAMLIAIRDFEESSGWIIDTDYQHYKQLK